MFDVNDKSKNAAPVEIHKLRWWRADHLDSIGKRIDAINAEWDKEWLADGKIHATNVEVASTTLKKHLVSAGWHQISGASGQIFWIQTPSQYLEHLQKIMFSENRLTSFTLKSNGKIGRNLAEVAWKEYVEKLADLLSLLDFDISVGAPPLDLFKAWSGAVRLEVPWYGEKLVLLLNKECIEQLLREDILEDDEKKRRLSRTVPRGKLCSIVQAVRQKKVCIRVTLSSCEIELGHLQQIQVGDVIPLPHGLEQPLLVEFSSGEVLCQAFLGASANKKAIEVFGLAQATSSE